MVDTKKTQRGQAQEQTDTQTSSTSKAPDYKSDRGERKEASQQLFRALFRTGVHVAMAPVYMLPEEPRDHFITAGREITRVLATLEHERVDDFENAVHQLIQELERR